MIAVEVSPNRRVGNPANSRYLSQGIALTPEVSDLFRINVDRGAFPALSCSLSQKRQKTVKRGDHTSVDV